MKLQKQETEQLLMEAKSSLCDADAFALELEARHCEEMVEVKKQFQKMKMNFQVDVFCCVISLIYIAFN